MNFNNPIPRSGLPNLYAGSGMRSPRDSDATPRLWQKSAPVQKQLARTSQAVEQLQRQFNRLRRSRGGGESTTSSTAFRGEWDPTASYTVGNIVVISVGVNIGTYICVIDTDGINVPYNSTGYWVQLPAPSLLGQWI